MNHIKKTLDILQSYYADREGNLYPLNDVQIAVYVDALSAIDPEKLETGARAWMKSNKWFPKVSELLDLIQPEPDLKQAALIAWAGFENAVRRFGSVGGIEFENPEVAETIRRTFGSWSNVGNLELGSPQWAIKRQSFLALYEACAKSHDADDFTAYLGHFYKGQDHPFVGHMEGLPEPGWQKIRSGRELSTVTERKALL